MPNGPIMRLVVPKNSVVNRGGSRKWRSPH